MPTVSELRIEVQREVQGLLALVDRQAPQRATEAETALWVGVLLLGVSMMRLFFTTGRYLPREDHVPDRKSEHGRIGHGHGHGHGHGLFRTVAVAVAV